MYMSHYEVKTNTGIISFIKYQNLNQQLKKINLKILQVQLNNFDVYKITKTVQIHRLYHDQPIRGN